MRALIAAHFFIALNTCFTVSHAQSMKDSIIVPNIFTPNQDGINDIFKPTFIFQSRVQTTKLEIFDRFGKLVTSSKGVISWDGRDNSGVPCPDGTYFYVIEFIHNSAKQESKGFVQLIKQ